ncbi:MAG: S8 family serine peptidase [Candidatus Sericytochromatia bacterium]|nr:S8 family serine peptidase [Candidatus Sericytochromatia bacterium]
MRGLSLLVSLAVVLAGCGAGQQFSPVAHGVTGGKFKPRSLRADGSRFSKHHVLLRAGGEVQPAAPGVVVSQRFGEHQVHRLPPGLTVEQAIAAYQQAPGVTRIERLELFPVEQQVAPAPAAPPAIQVPRAPAPAAAANDPRLFEQWSHAIARVPGAWQITRGRPDVLVAALDTGADASHPDLLGQVIDGPDMAEGKPDSRDIDSHGTHVAGIIAAKADNGIGVAGVAPGCRVLAIKIFEPYFEDGKYKGTYYNPISLAKALHYAATQGGAKVINISAGIADDELVSQMLAFARGHGLVVCVSAGNRGSNAYTGQAKYLDGVLAVHATDPMDRLARFSNFGHTLGVSAPGASILSTVPTYAHPHTGEPPKGDGFESLNGTSMASPFVAAVAALATSAMLEAVESNLRATTGRDVKLTPAQLPGALVEDLIRQSCVDLGVPGRDEVYGAGRVDAERAVRAAQSPEWVERATRETLRMRRR